MITVGRSLQPVYLTHEHDKGRTLITLLVVAFVRFFLEITPEYSLMNSGVGLKVTYHDKGLEDGSMTESKTETMSERVRN